MNRINKDQNVNSPTILSGVLVKSLQIGHGEGESVKQTFS